MEQLINSLVMFKTRNTIAQFGDKWLHGTLELIDDSYVIISGLPYVTDGLIIQPVNEELESLNR